MFCLIIGMELTLGNVNDVPRKMDHNICGWHSSSNFGFRMLNFTNFTSKGRLKSGVMIHRGILSVLVFVFKFGENIAMILFMFHFLNIYFQWTILSVD